MKTARLPSVFTYKKRYLKKDIIAALVVTAIAIPESLAFAVIAGLPLEIGLYTAVFAPVMFGLLASTRRLVVGADSATAALIAAGAGLVATSSTSAYLDAVALLGLTVGILLLIMARLKLGFLADLISRPVLVGFLSGIGVQLIVSKFPEMIGIEGASGALWQRAGYLVSHLGEINGMTLTVSMLVVGVIIMTHRTKIPGELLALVLATIFAIVFHVSRLGVDLVGALPAGLPMPRLPLLDFDAMIIMLPTALSIAIVILAQSSLVIRSIGSEHDDKIQLNRDLFALGTANIVSGFTRGMIVNGSPPRSAAADLSGGKTQLVNIVMGILIGIVLMIGTGLFEFVPTAALASIVCVVGVRLIRVNEFVAIWRAHRSEFAVAIISLLGVALLGVRNGVLIAIVVSLMERLSRQYRPKDRVLLRDGQVSQWLEDRLGGEPISAAEKKGLLIYSFDGALFFENMQYFTRRVRAAIDKAESPVTYLIIDAGAMDSIDYTAMVEMKQLYRQLSSDGIKIAFAHVSPGLREQLDGFGVVDLLGKHNIFTTLSAAIKAELNRSRTVRQRVLNTNLSPDEYVVIGGGVLELLNLRDSSDVDIVVSPEVYRHLHIEEQWSEQTIENGRKIISRNGCNAMHSWKGYAFERLKARSIEVEGITCMNLSDLVDAKHQIGRRKDLSDIDLIESYQARHS